MSNTDALRAALADLLKYAEGNECQHESTHRGGAIWTICDDCGRKWPDDRDPFTPYQEPKAIEAARAALAQPAASGEPADPMLACEIQPRPLSNPLTDYHCAGVNGTPLHYTWTDKPHRLLYDLIAAVRFYAQPAPARVPLTDAQISNMWAHECVRERLTRDLVLAFARAIEAAHGITAPGAPDAGPVQ